MRERTYVGRVSVHQEVQSVEIGVAREGSVMRGVEWIIEFGEAGGEVEIGEIREDGMGEIGSED